MMRMKKFINDPENLTPELLEGFAEAHKELVELGDQRMVINRKLPDADRVTIVTQADRAMSRRSADLSEKEWWISLW